MTDLRRRIRRRNRATFAAVAALAIPTGLTGADWRDIAYAVACFGLGWWEARTADLETHLQTLEDKAGERP